MSNNYQSFLKTLESMLSHPVWKKDKFLLRWAHDRIESSVKNLRYSVDKVVSEDSDSVVQNVSVFVEIYQKDLGIITLSRALSSLGGNAFSKNIYRSYDSAKTAAELNQRDQRHMAFIELNVLEENVKDHHECLDKVLLSEGSISTKNVKGAWFRGVFYNYNKSNGLFVRQ